MVGLAADLRPAGDGQVVDSGFQVMAVSAWFAIDARLIWLNEVERFCCVRLHALGKVRKE